MECHAISKELGDRSSGVPPKRRSRTTPAGLSIHLILCCFVFPASAHGQSVWYVDSSATGAVHDGQSWCRAFLTLGEALEVVGATDSIRIAAGSYSPDSVGMSDPREATFTLVSGISVLGGYAGCGASDPDNRDTSAFRTILTGDQSGNDPVVESDYRNCCNPTGLGCSDPACVQAVCQSQPFCCSGGWGGGCVQLAESMCGGLCASKDDNAYSVVTSLGMTGVVVDGVTIERGAADSGPDVNHKSTGAGLYASGGSLTINDCRFQDNAALFIGGGLYVSDTDITVSDCEFVRNDASQWDEDFVGSGGGALVVGGDPTFARSYFYDNYAGNAGSAIFLVDAGGVIESSTFMRNHASAVYLNASSPTIRDCDLLGNNGAIDMVGFSGPVISECRIVGNLNSGIAGSSVNPVVVTNCIIAANQAGGSGGGIRCGFDLTVTHSLLAHNSAFFRGGGIHVSGNRAVILRNSIVWGNVAQIDGANVFLSGPAGFEPSLIVEASDIEGGQNGVAGEGTVVWSAGAIDADPNFMDPDGADDLPGTIDDDYRLRTPSPCIDAGENDLIPAGVVYDLVGNVRVHDGDGDGVAVADMGPLEVVVAIPAASGWGFAVLSLLLAAAGSALVHRVPVLVRSPSSTARSSFTRRPRYTS